MGLLLCRIEYQPDVAYESVAYKKECNVILWSCKHMWEWAWVKAGGG